MAPETEVELVTKIVDLVLVTDRLNLLVQFENEQFNIKNLQNEIIYAGTSFEAVRAYVNGYAAGLKAAK